MHSRDGSYSSGPEETLEILLTDHFPQCENFPRFDGSDPERQISHWELLDDRLDFLTELKIGEAFRSFGSFKAAGPDGLQPLVLKNLGPTMRNRLLDIYKASLLLRHVPSIWRSANVIFLPKPGKDDYANVRSFRPISLSPFLFKALERLLWWHPALRQAPR